MRARTRSATLACLLALAVAGAVSPTPAEASTPDGLTIARQTLPTGDGWGSSGTGTTGGSTADAQHVYTVHTRQELVNALKPGDGLPRIVIVEGSIDASSDATGKHLGCLDYYPDYSFDAYFAAAKAVYDLNPGLSDADKARRVESLKADPTFSALETKRAAAAKAELKTRRFYVPANTTIIGRKGATLQGGMLMLDRVDNVILRNLAIKDPVSCFPQYPGDEWIAENFDAVSLWTATHIWIDHMTIDGALTKPEPTLLGYLFHNSDGVLDMVRATDFVTVSWSEIKNGDKAMLWGNTNNPDAYHDNEHLRITLHHNRLENLYERQPRVRFGQVHVYDNHYVLNGDRYGYTWGVGVGSRLWIEDNAVTAPSSITAADLIYNWGGTAIHAGTTLFNCQPVDVLAAYNAAHDPDLGTDVGWTPTRYGPRHPVWMVPLLVAVYAGAGKLG